MRSFTRHPCHGTKLMLPDSRRQDYCDDRLLPSSCKLQEGHMSPRRRLEVSPRSSMPRDERMHDRKRKRSCLEVHQKLVHIELPIRKTPRDATCIHEAFRTNAGVEILHASREVSRARKSSERRGWGSVVNTLPLVENQRRGRRFDRTRNGDIAADGVP